ncbi:MAG: YidC/Oxa1 family membrane protein insertase [Ruminococcus sp.]|uniref:YidC/Oxa1 family membrane protein insertase n=1 Tax=Ruminococcus sp. TaxID=41978 RepID=UPI0025ED62B7|nr:YidC/Oxa1 family membrane protein insertase [Ruminococcus sp.]MCR4794754.1 YidC/Oxa1 family membrane protein insertase [Ruminococcus sp.]
MNALYDIIGVPFGYLMRIIYSLCNNYAVAIILFTVITKILLFPVNYKTQKSSARMQLLNPKLEKLKKSFANNPQRLQEEQQKLYQQEGVNPMGSCLPMFIQMFLLFGVIDVIYKPITHILDISKNVINQACGIAGADKSNLRCELITMEHLRDNADKYSSLPEKFLSKVTEFTDQFTIFGANLGRTPTLHPESWTKEAIVLCAIPFLAGLSQLLVSVYSQMHQKKVNPASQPGGGCLTFMTYFFPILSIWFAFQVPAGVGFYWIWSSIFSFIITFALNCYFTPERIKVINEQEKEKARIYAEKHPNKKTFMQKMMEQQAALEQQNNGGSSSGKANGVSRSEQNKQNRDKLKEARRRMAEKYGDSYDDNDDED